MIDHLDGVGDADVCLARIAASRGELLSILAGLSDGQFHRRPDEEAWSAGMIAHHVGMVEKGTARIVQMLGVASQRGTQLQVQVPQGRRREDGRMIAPASVTPPADAARPEIMEMLSTSRMALLQAIGEHRPDLEGTATMDHPFYGPLTGLGWLRMITVHEEWHVEQLRRVQQTAPSH
ncbi:MAG TPA: DinB family protein [Candidatus Kapabacteria bacterium]|nr:DinB family protein [Candidatus Kapabacteria bacterium]